MIVQFEDKSGKAKSYQQEVMTSFRFDSGRPFGDTSEREFVSKLKKTVSADTTASVAYVIIGGGAITISIPSAEPERTKGIVTDLFESYPITLFDIKIISRERA
jgi:hypothetical protein